MASIVYCADAFHTWPSVKRYRSRRCEACGRGPDDHHIVKVQNYELDGHIAICANHECDWSEVREGINSYARVLRRAEAHAGKGCGVVDADLPPWEAHSIHPHARAHLRG